MIDHAVTISDRFRDRPRGALRADRSIHADHGYDPAIGAAASESL